MNSRQTNSVQFVILATILTLPCSVKAAKTRLNNVSIVQLAILSPNVSTVILAII
jgi:hypothetical protein